MIRTSIKFISNEGKDIITVYICLDNLKSISLQYLTKSLYPGLIAMLNH